jgi:hypothetical protein
MKTKNYIRFLTGSILAIVVLSSSCKKDRVQQDDYQSMDSFYNQYKEEEQEFIIDSTGSCPLIAKKGTKICISADMLMFINGTGITYPFTLKVVELYSIKDMLLWRIPAIAGGSILETSAEIRVRAFKNNTELVLKPGKKYYMEMDTMATLNNNMQAYYGFDNGGINDWAVETLSSVSVNAYFYSLNVARMGWISSARLHPSAAQNTTVTLSATGTNTQNIEVFLSFVNFKGLMRVTNLISGPVPIGEQVTLVAMAKNQNNDYVLDKQTFTVTVAQQITLNMQVISEADLLTALNGL